MGGSLTGPSAAVISSETTPFLMKINITLDRGSQREMFHSNYFCPCFVPLPYESTSPLKTFLEMFMFRLEFFLGSFQLWSEAALAGKAAT